MKKWLIVSISLVIVLLILAFSNTNLGTHISNFTEVYADEALHENAINIANDDEEVLKNFGEIALKDNLSLLNGDVQYSDNQNSVKLIFKVNGTKANGVMDIEAHRINDVWEYDNIHLRDKDSLRVTIE
ncbi:cytochrome c oxidase assembly factor Coa1 family protein [Zunongwangia endophytica]|uniref:Cytochrome c oxidase assembly factor Coa1 family protein n=1 Tax=Zunongwangia endophytica TaxID=1808945 RepID=A0ABV8HH67_9FLAO|nr:cytochrome c oxidase assembly factor Coa1 family protein [Zunongwangia endophytica]MDN3594160.1 cytochrome c oxidase assembly factor Coa1 family protein [Zunongwangia endophytica]